MTQKQHLAQLNIGRARYSLDDRRMAGFMNNLDRVNAVAERSDGFVWRLKGEGNNATDQLIDPGDPRMIPNLSVWENGEALEAFVFRTIHKQFYLRREMWFEKLPGANLVMWWIRAGHQPTLDEALERLDLLNRNGPSEEAFGWATLLGENTLKPCA